MRKHTSHLDHHQSFRYVTTGLQEKFHWGLQLISNQKEKLFDSHKKKLSHEQKFFQPTQPIPKPNCDRSGQLDNTQDVIGVQTCPSEENKIVGVEQIHDRSGQPDKCSHATPTTSYFVKELRKTWTSKNSRDYHIPL